MIKSPEYLVPASTVTVETEAKKSKFIATLTGVASREAATFFFKQVGNDHTNANHNCTAFIVGNPNSAADLGCSDDGEPAGTAGKPMLNVLQHNNIGNVAVVVTRYFGGIKLGTGGLVRAYSGAVKSVLEVVVVEEYFKTKTIELSFHYQFETIIRNLINEITATLVEANYSTQVTLKIELAEHLYEDFHNRVLDATKGATLFKER